MAVSLRKPILVGGITISLGLWALESFQHSIMEAGEVGIAGIIALGTGLWYLQKKVFAKKEAVALLTPLSREAVESAIASTLNLLSQLETEAPQKDITALKAQVAYLSEGLERKALQLAITGGKGVGKSTLKGLLQEMSLEKVTEIVETEPLFAYGETSKTSAKDVSFASDAVLFLVNGDCKESELKTLQELINAHSRVVLILNQQDRYIPEERAMILQQLQQRLQGLIAPNDIISLATAPAPVKVRQHQEDGTVKEWLEQPQADLTALQSRLTEILASESQSLVWATTWREAMQLKRQAKDILNEVRRDRALPIIEQYQWVAAAAAFANPVAALDLLATVAINGQMIVDLGEVYQQKFSLSQAQASAGALGKLMVKLGLVELSTQTVGGMLKSNAVTYVAGGAVQGVSAAYLTRVAGLSLIEYFQEQDPTVATATGFNLDALGQKLQNIFQQNSRTAFLQGFVQQATQKLSLTHS